MRTKLPQLGYALYRIIHGVATLDAYQSYLLLPLINLPEAFSPFRYLGADDVNATHMAVTCSSSQRGLVPGGHEKIFFHHKIARG